MGHGDWEPTPEQEARWKADVEAWRRGELPFITLEEFQPLLAGWIEECQELTRLRDEAGIPEGQHWEPPGGFRDWSAEEAALPWKTRNERKRDGEDW